MERKSECVGRWVSGLNHFAVGAWNLQIAPIRASAQAGPIVGYQDGIGGIGGVVLDAGWLGGDQLVEAHLAFKTGDVLRGVVGDAGDGIAIGNELARAQVGERPGTGEETFRCARLGRVRDELGDLAFRYAADLVQMKAAPAFDFFGIFRGAKKGVGDHGDGGNRGATHGEKEFPIIRHCIQGDGSAAVCRAVHALTSLGSGYLIHRSQPAQTPRTQFYPSEMVRDYWARGACTGVRNRPIPATLTSATSPATSGPTPAGVPVAITSPGSSVIMREIQRTRKAQG